MKESYNPYSKLPSFIELDDNEVRVIEEALKICDRGFKFIQKICGEDEFHRQWTDFRHGRSELKNILAGGNLHYYKERKRGMENWTKYMKGVHECWERERKKQLEKGAAKNEKAKS